MEGILSKTDLIQIIQNKFDCSEFEVVEWTFKKDFEYSGFYGFPSKEYIAVKLQNGKITGLHLFIRRILTGKGYHAELIDKLQVFPKEFMLYNKILTEIMKNISGKIYPECYLIRKNGLVILEDLNVLGFKSIGKTNTFTFEQIESTLKTLSKLHSGSIIFEEKAGIRLDKVYSEALLETHFVSDFSHPWFHNGCITINAIEAIVEAFFPHTSPEVYEKAYDVMRTLPYSIIPSQKHRNVLSHGCVTSSDVLFRTNEGGDIETIITGFKHARYNTPALDITLAILLTTNSKLRSEYFQSLLVEYYNSLSRELERHSIDVKDILTWDQFNDSVRDVELIASAMTVTHLQMLLLPAQKLSKILKSDKDCREFIEVDRSDIVLEEMRNNNVYRKRMIQAISDLFGLVECNKRTCA